MNHQDEQPDLQLLSGMAMLLHGCQDEDGLVEVAEQYLPNMFPHASGAMFFLQGDQPYTPSLTWGDDRRLAEDLSPSLEHDACHALSLRMPYAAGALNQEAKHCTHVTAGSNFASLCLPLVTRDEPLGLLTIVTRTSGELPKGTLGKKTGLGIATAECLGLALSNIRLRKQLSDQATKDPLTGLYNRRHMRKILQATLSSSERRSAPMSLALLDIDFFKRFNDEYGHDAGDEVLVAVAALLRMEARAGCSAYRFGGEEMLVLMPETPHNEALEAAERLRETIGSLSVPHDEAALPRVTVSIGVSTWPEDGTDTDQLLKTADERLYLSKENGRNQVTGR